MKKYQVTLTYRQHYNSLERSEKTYVLTAPNKQVVLVKAGFLMASDGVYHVPDSLAVKEVRQV